MCENQDSLRTLKFWIILINNPGKKDQFFEDLKLSFNQYKAAQCRIHSIKTLDLVSSINPTSILKISSQCIAYRSDRTNTCSYYNI